MQGERTLVFTGMAGEPDTLNPLISASSDLFSLSHLYMSLLVESDGKGRLIPDIARSVPVLGNGISKDGRTIVYHLRRGLRWQDGAPLTARDVVFSYHAVMNPVNNVLTRVGYAEVDRIRAPNDTTVVIHLRRPFSPIVSYFFGPQGGPAIMPAHLLDKYEDLNRVAYNQRPVGSGPFRVVEWRHGDRVILEANPLYWRGRPHIDRIVYRIIPDPNTRTEELQSDEVDAYFDVDPQMLPTLRASSMVRIVMTPVNDVHVLEFNLRDPVVGDVRVRRAVAHAIDREKLMQVATHGAGIALEGDQPRNGWAYDPRLDRIRYDPQTARRLLEQSGWHMGPGGIRSRKGRLLEPLAGDCAARNQRFGAGGYGRSALSARRRDRRRHKNVSAGTDVGSENRRRRSGQWTLPAGL